MMGSRLGYLLAPWTWALVGLVTAALAALTLWQTEAPGPLPLAPEFRAPPPRTPADIAALRAYARARLALSPTDTGAWVSLAYAARAEEGRCGRACNAALAQS